MGPHVRDPRAQALVDLNCQVSARRVKAGAVSIRMWYFIFIAGIASAAIGLGQCT